MATTTHIEEKPRIIVPRASRGNEILAILFIALGLLLALCLISAAFYPNDPSWNSAGQSQTQNWAGAIGANSWNPRACDRGVGAALDLEHASAV